MIKEWKKGKKYNQGMSNSTQVKNPVPEDILSDFWMTHSNEYLLAVKVRGRFFASICAFVLVLSTAVILAGMLTFMVWLIFDADVILSFNVLFIASLPFVILDQIFRRTYESVRMGFDRRTVLRQAFFGRSLVGYCYGTWWHWR